MNNLIIQQFNSLIDSLYIDKPTHYSFKIKSFKNVITKINNINFDITLSNLNTLKFSDKINHRIKEILNNGSLIELQNTTNSSNIDKKKMLDLSTITGIGPAKAKQLLDNNITLDILLNNPSKDILQNLTHHQIIGIKYYKDLQKKIPHEVILNIKQFLKQFNFEFTICGSFRRNLHSSGDIDILICQNPSNNLILKNIISDLKKSHFITDDLTVNGNTKYMGICKLPTQSNNTILNFKQYMRIDIRLVSKDSYPFAILYFTGSKQNNTYMRKQAIKMNLKLNEYGLFDKDNKAILLNNEKEIFEYLNLDYILPHLR